MKKIITNVFYTLQVKILIVLSIIINIFTFSIHVNGNEYTDSIFKLGVDYFNATNGKLLDREKGYSLILQAAETGLADAQYEIGRFYNNGIHVEQNDSLALEWFKLAAKQNHAIANNACGVYYMNSTATDENFGLAFEYFQKGAALNYVSSYFNLGLCYLEGKGTERDLTKATYYFRKAAELNYADGQYVLAQAYYSGEGVTQDQEKAYYWAKIASENGHAQACNLAGVIIIDTKPKEAFNLFMQSYNSGDIQGLKNLAWCFADGKGCDANVIYAAKLFEEGANRGDSECMYRCGKVLYEEMIVKNYDGKPNNEKSKLRGEQLLIESARKGFTEAVEYCNDNKISF